MLAPLSRGTLTTPTHLTELAGFRLSVTAHAPSFRTPRHSHECASINLVLDGVYAERVAGASRGYPPGTVVIKPAGEPHTNEFSDSGARCLLIEARPSTLTRRPSLSGLFETCRDWSADHLSPSITRLVRELTTTTDDLP